MNLKTCMETRYFAHGDPQSCSVIMRFPWLKSWSPKLSLPLSENHIMIYWHKDNPWFDYAFKNFFMLWRWMIKHEFWPSFYWYRKIHNSNKSIQNSYWDFHIWFICHHASDAVHVGFMLDFIYWREINPRIDRCYLSQNNFRRLFRVDATHP